MLNKKSCLIFVVFLLSICLMAASSGANVFAQAQDEQKVTSLVIRGNNTVSADTILLKIKTVAGRALIQKQLKEDIKRLYATGFFADVNVETEKYQDGVRVTIIVVEKAIVDKIVIKGNKSIRQDRLLKEIETKAGDVFSKRIIASDIKKLKAFYRKKGFSLVDITYDIDIDSANKAAVFINVDEKSSYRIKKIDFKGNNAFKRNVLLKQLATKTAGWFRSGILDTYTLDEDIEKLKIFYQGNGYIDIEINSNIEYSIEQKGINITIDIKEGPQYKTGKITINGNVIFSASELTKELKMKKADPYNPQQLRTDVIKIQTKYFDKGYMNCRIVPETLLDKSSTAIDIIYTITENNIVYLSKIVVTGNTKTKDKVIRRELRLYPGDKYEGEKLRRSKERLYNLGFFEEITFDTAVTTEPDKKDLVVSVKEAKTGEFSFGGGYSSVDRAIGFVEVSQKNFDIMNFPTFTGAGQDLTVRGSFGSVRRNYELSFTEPWIFDYPLLFGLDLYNLQTLRKSGLGYGYDETHQGGNLRLGKEFTDYNRADLKYSLESVEIADVPSDASGALKNEEGQNTISSLTLALTRDTRNNKFNPISGYIISSAFKNGGGLIGGDKDFFKMMAISSAYFNLDEKLVLELKCQAGWVNEYDNTESVPIYERFFAGGAETIRGYKERSIGPIDANTADPIGGESMTTVNLELTYPVFKNFKIATFFDTGNVWESSDDLFNGNLKSSLGVGVRVNTPIGPIKVDYGYPLDEAHPGDSKKGRFHFSMTRGF